MRTAEFVIAILNAVFGLALVVGSFTLNPGKAGDPGPGLFPLLLGAFCLLNTVGQLIRAFRLDPRTPPAVNGRWRLALSTIGLSALYLAAMPVLGYFLATLVMIPAMVWYLGVRSPRWALGSSIVYVIFAWAMFYYLFMVPLPEGFLGDLLGI